VDEEKLTVPSTAFKEVAIDATGPFPKTKEGYKFIIVVTDLLTRWVEAHPTRTLDSEDTAKVLMKVVLRHGMPRSILSDGGTNFTSEATEDLLKLLKLNHKITPPEHPQSNGLCERMMVS